MSLLTEVGAAAAVMVVMLAVVMAGRRRHVHRATWINELASARSEREGDLSELDDVASSSVPVDQLAGREVTGPDGAMYREYGGEEVPLTRVGGDEHAATADGATLIVEISRGSVWRLAETGSWHPSELSPLLVRTTACEVRADRADLLVTCEPDGWTYVLCFGGAAVVASDADSATLGAGQVARLHVANGSIQVVEAPPGSLEGDEVVRLHRRLDRGAVACTPSPVGAGR